MVMLIMFEVLLSPCPQGDLNNFQARWLHSVELMKVEDLQCLELTVQKRLIII